MTDIFSEVDEDLRRDRALAFWKRWGSLFLGIAVAIVVAVAAVTWWKRHQAAQQAQATATLIQLLDKVPAAPKETADLLAGYAANAGADHALLARLNEASARLQAGDTVQAVAIYDQIANNPKTDALVRDMCVLRSATIQFDTGDAKALTDRLRPLAAPGAPFAGLARELTALLAAKSGDRAGAAKLFGELAEDTTTPPAIAQRARELAQLYRGES